MGAIWPPPDFGGSVNQSQPGEAEAKIELMWQKLEGMGLNGFIQGVVDKPFLSCTLEVEVARFFTT